MSLDVYLSCGCCKRDSFDANITHNLRRIANKAGIYQYLWCPKEIGITTAEELIQPLTDGLAYLNEHTAELRELEPVNGWGTVENLIDFVTRYRDACVANPTGAVEVSK